MNNTQNFPDVHSIINARIIDPASDYDGDGVITFENGVITDIGPDVLPRGETIDARGLIAAPGLIDMRVQTGEPGRESKETLATAGRAAAAGGVTSFVVMPDTRPIIDDMALVDYIMRRGEQDALVNVLVAGALTKDLDGKTLTEIGLMSEAGAVLFSNGPEPITDAQIMRRLLSYSATFNALIANRATEPSLSDGTCAHESDLSSRLGLMAAPAISERLMVERDVALAELTGGRLLIDLISSREALDVIKRAKTRDLDIAVSVSINHLCLNELDIGDYRTFAKLDPPLRDEADRLALIDGINAGVIDVIVSDHDPRPAGEKRLPYAEASAGAVGLDILLSAGLSQVADGKLDLTAFLAALTINPATLLGLSSGRLAKGAPADIILIDPHKPWVCSETQLLSKSKNTPFDGRRMTGRCVQTIVGGITVFDTLTR
ncbi:dihydroorotase [Fretibacter rubidus]|uniref:dihydroorotase n=1 Tax=Fretibacter rubidus TaxID=570162 RepID=UPI00352B1CCA